ncbi:MAG: insulinase family protein [Candidatus Omnitrophica bacterium]|nr:insulinase family protein [Candidatus Omnitrophota bacterium]
MYKKSILPNKLRIATHDMLDKSSVSLGLLLGVGSRYEGKTQSGSAHFLEHIVFKGSEKYSCQEIKELIEGKGGNLNAFTSEEVTCFYAKVPSDNLERTFDILADLVISPRILPEDVEKERSVILEEIKMYKDQPQYQVLELIDSLLWPKHPLGINISGTSETVSKLSVDDLKKFHASYYVPNNMVIAACGKIRHSEFESMVLARMGKIAKKSVSSYTKADNVQSAPRIKLVKKPIEQMHVAFGVIGLDIFDENRFKLALLSIILGGNMSSRLFAELREKRGLAYSIGSVAKGMQDTGCFLIRAGVDNSKLIESLDLIIEELEKIKKTGVTDNELKRAKEYVCGQLVLGLEDSMEHMLWVGEAILSKDKFNTVDEIIKKFRRVEPDDIKDIANKLLLKNRYNLAIVGPVTEKQQNRINKSFSLK